MSSTPDERSPEAVLPEVVAFLAGMKGELFLQLSLGASGEVVDVEALACAVHPKQGIPAPLLLERPKQVGASSIIFASNTTNALCGPHQTDIDFTRRLVAAGERAGIPVIDHYLVDSNSDFVSLRGTTNAWGN